MSSSSCWAIIAASSLTPSVSSVAPLGRTFPYVLLGWIFVSSSTSMPNINCLDRPTGRVYGCRRSPIGISSFTFRNRNMHWKFLSFIRGMCRANRKNKGRFSSSIQLLERLAWNIHELKSFLLDSKKSSPSDDSSKSEIETSEYCNGPLVSARLRSFLISSSLSGSWPKPSMSLSCSVRVFFFLLPRPVLLSSFCMIFHCSSALNEYMFLEGAHGLDIRERPSVARYVRDCSVAPSTMLFQS